MCARTPHSRRDFPRAEELKRTPCTGMADPPDPRREVGMRPWHYSVAAVLAVGAFPVAASAGGTGGHDDQGDCHSRPHGHYATVDVARGSAHFKKPHGGHGGRGARGPPPLKAPPRRPRRPGRKGGGREVKAPPHPPPPHPPKAIPDADSD